MSDCYVAIKPCGCCTGAAVIDLSSAKETAEYVSDWIRRGYKVQLKNTEWVRINLRGCKCGAKQNQLPIPEKP